jgi:hypothetical protein
MPGTVLDKQLGGVDGELHHLAYGVDLSLQAADAAVVKLGTACLLALALSPTSLLCVCTRSRLLTRFFVVYRFRRVCGILEGGGLGDAAKHHYSRKEGRRAQGEVQV